METNALAIPKRQIVDSLAVNEFRVELDGQLVSGVLRISGLVPFKLDIKSVSAFKLQREPLTLTKMAHSDPDHPFNTWLRETIASQTDIARPKRTLTIVAVDEGVEVRRWTINGAWVSELRYSEFDSGSHILLEEMLVVQWENCEISWTVG